MFFNLSASLVAIVVFAILFLANAIRILNEYERGVIFRLGRVIRAKGPGIILLIPVLDRMQRVSLRVIAQEVPTQDVITRDNVSVKVSAVIYFRVIEPVKAVISVENYLYATSQLAQTTLRTVCGHGELDTLLSEKDKINAHIQEILDSHTDPWGIKVSLVELKQIDLPQEMQRAMAKQAEAERDRRGGRVPGRRPARRRRRYHRQEPGRSSASLFTNITRDSHGTKLHYAISDPDRFIQTVSQDC